MSINSGISKILTHFNIKETVPMGVGGESCVYSYKKNLVLKIYTKEEISEDYLSSLAELQTTIQKYSLPYDTPEILKIGELDGIVYVIEKKLMGISMEKVFPTLSLEEKRKLLTNYYQAISVLGQIKFSKLPYGNILAKETQITSEHWSDFLTQKVTQRLARAGKRIIDDIPDISSKLEDFIDITRGFITDTDKSLVHADYYVNQVLVDEDNRISALLDISYHSVVGDKRLDLASVPIFYGEKEYSDYVDFATSIVTREYGKHVQTYLDFYRMYYCFYISNIYNYLPSFYKYVVKTLNNKYLWDKLRHLR